MHFIRSRMVWIIAAVILAGGMLGWGWWQSWQLDYTQGTIRWGVSYDPYYAVALGLNPRSTFEAILHDLKVNRVRLSIRWDEVEGTPGEYDWRATDQYIAQASQANARIVLAIGAKVPRWPECYQPTWARQLSPEEYRAALLRFVETTVRHYQPTMTIVAWQVENEPLVDWFGVCPQPDPDLVRQEIALVKQLDSRPILVTDSGELSWWGATARLGGDWFGSTMYRVVRNPYFGFWKWPTPPAFYHWKAQWLRQRLGQKLERVIISELQAEPWVITDMAKTPLEEQFRSMDLNQFKENIDFAKRAGFDEVYLWGVEWWYWLKETQDTPDFWEEARTLWVKPPKESTPSEPTSHQDGDMPPLAGVCSPEYNSCS